MGHGPTQRASQDTERPKTTTLSRLQPDLRRGPAESGPVEKPNSHRQWQKAYDLSTPHTGLLLQDLGSASRSEWEHRMEDTGKKTKSKGERQDVSAWLSYKVVWVFFLQLFFKTILQILYFLTYKKNLQNSSKALFVLFFFLQVSLMPSYVTVAQFSRTGD